MRAKRLNHRKYNLSVGRLYSVAFEEVKKSVGVGSLVGVKTVKIHDLQKWLVAYARDRDIVDLNAGSIAQILDVHLEISLLHLIGAKRIDILHHEVPHGQFRRGSGALEHLHK